MGAVAGVDHNAGATYCNYYVKGYPGLDAEALPEANWSIAGDPCRLRAWNIFSLYGALALIFFSDDRKRAEAPSDCIRGPIRAPDAKDESQGRRRPPPRHVETSGRHWWAKVGIR